MTHSLSEPQVQEIIDACQLMVDRYTREGGTMWASTRDSIIADPIAAAEELRKILGIGVMMHNRAKCPSCNQIIESKFRHDARDCRCKESFVDGGSWYCRIGGTAMPMIEQWPWLKYLDGNSE